MEHRLIQGGEYLYPFAHSLVAKLKKLGLPYADQSFAVDGVSIKVRIQPGHEYIRIESSGVPILCGVARDSKIIDLPVPTGSPDGTLPVKVLRAFKPTAETKKFTSFKSHTAPPSTFEDEKRLPVLPDWDVSVAIGAQTGSVFGCRYSGKMAKLVQLILGYGKDGSPPDGYTQVHYDFRWSKCHGITTASDDSLWLIEISNANGVLAMPLPMKTKNKAELLRSKYAVMRETGKLFGGIPSGATFPKGAALTAAIASGSVLSLLPASGLVSFYQKSPYSVAMGWSINQAGSEAHNTCYFTDSTDGRLKSCHYKIDITISVATDGTSSGSATLTLVECLGLAAVPADAYSPTPSAFNLPMTFASEYKDSVLPRLTPDWDPASPATTVTPAAPLFVCHINDQLEVVRTSTAYPGMTITSDSYLNPVLGADGVGYDYWSVASPYHAPLSDGRFHVIVTFCNKGVTRSYLRGAVWPNSARDCYAVLDGAETEFWDFSTGYYLSDEYPVTGGDCFTYPAQTVIDYMAPYAPYFSKSITYPSSIYGPWNTKVDIVTPDKVHTVVDSGFGDMSVRPPYWRGVSSIYPGDPGRYFVYHSTFGSDYSIVHSKRLFTGNAFIGENGELDASGLVVGSGIPTEWAPYAHVGYITS